MIHTKWTELTKICEKMSTQIKQSNIETNNLQKINSDLESKLKESQDSVVTLNAELEKLKKSVKMLNYGSSKMDEILSARRIEKYHFGLGYPGQTGIDQTVFVKGSSSGVNVEEDVKGKRPAVTPVRTPAVMKFGKARVTTPARTPAVVTATTSSERVREKRWIPICHYCNRRGHIRPQCYQYLADLRRVGKKMPHSRRSTKQVWVKKSNLRCNMVCTVEDMNVKEKVFHGKQVADMQGELDLCGDVVSDVPALVVDTPSVRVNDSTKKHEERGRIPLFFIFLCLFLAKRGSMC